MSSNRYIARPSKKIYFFVTTSGSMGIYSVWLMVIDTYPEVIKKMYFV